MKILSIIIVNWNTTDHLVQCLNSILERPPTAEFEIIVVDNNSDEDISSLTNRFPDVRFIKCEYNYGFAVGNNIGYRNSSGKYVMTLNPDTIIGGETIDNLVETLDQNEDVGIASPVLQGQKPNRSQYRFLALFLNSTVMAKVRQILGRFSRSEKKESFDVEFLGGTGYMCRSAILEAGGFFSERHFLFGEEYYLCRLVRSKHYKIRVVPSARFEHFASVSFKNDPERLAMASTLGSAVGWRIRKEYLGTFLSAVTGTLLCIEHGVKLVALIASRPFVRAVDGRRDRIFGQSRSVVRSYIPLLLNEEEYLAKLNVEAERFFNGGRNPARPAVFSEVNEPSKISKGIVR